MNVIPSKIKITPTSSLMRRMANTRKLLGNSAGKNLKAEVALFDP